MTFLEPSSDTAPDDLATEDTEATAETVSHLATDAGHATGSPAGAPAVLAPAPGGDAIDAAPAGEAAGPEAGGAAPAEIELTGDEELLSVTDLAGDEQVLSPYDRPGDWYVVHTYSGYENKVKNNLASRVRSMGVEERIHEVVIPMEDVIEYKGGRKTVVQRKVFPGYLLVRMDLDDNSWYVVRNTPGVTGFVGSGAKPTPLSRREVEDILGVEQPEGEAPIEKKARPRLDFELGDQVRVTQGPFADFDGAIAEIDEDRAKLKVLVNIFGRETPVELEFGQVAKL
jgi:transcriptional antiterminator NusG